MRKTKGKWYRCRWHVRLGCWEQHRKQVVQRAQERFGERHRQKLNAAQRSKQAARYALEIRKHDLPFLAKQRRARRLAANPEMRKMKSKGLKYRQCPEPGCTNLMAYHYRPPDRCESCWDRVAIQRAGGDA